MTDAQKLMHDVNQEAQRIIREEQKGPGRPRIIGGRFIEVEAYDDLADESSKALVNVHTIQSVTPFKYGDGCFIHFIEGDLDDLEINNSYDDVVKVLEYFFR